MYYQGDNIYFENEDVEAAEVEWESHRPASCTCRRTITVLNNGTRAATIETDVEWSATCPIHASD